MNRMIEGIKHRVKYHKYHKLSRCRTAPSSRLPSSTSNSPSSPCCSTYRTYCRSRSYNTVLDQLQMFEISRDHKTWQPCNCLIMSLIIWLKTQQSLKITRRLHISACLIVMMLCHILLLNLKWKLSLTRTFYSTQPYIHRHYVVWHLFERLPIAE